MRDKDYLLGTSDRELQRLGFQHQVWLRDASDLWHRAGFAPGQRLLDLGCGPGFTTLDLADLVTPAGHVTALDASARYVDYLNLQLAARGLAHVDAGVGDVMSLALEDKSVDGVFARWLLCFLAEPGRLLAEVRRVLRPGGRVAIIDYFKYLSASIEPPRGRLGSLFELFDRSARAHQTDFEIAGRLPRLLAESGLRVLSVEPLCRVGRPGSPYWAWLGAFIDSYLPKVVEQGFANQSEADEIYADWQALADDPHAFFFTPPMLAIIAERPRDGEA